MEGKVGLPGLGPRAQVRTRPLSRAGTTPRAQARPAARPHAVTTGWGARPLGESRTASHAGGLRLWGQNTSLTRLVTRLRARPGAGRLFLERDNSWCLSLRGLSAPWSSLPLPPPFYVFMGSPLSVKAALGSGPAETGYGGRPGCRSSAGRPPPEDKARQSPESSPQGRGAGTEPRTAASRTLSHDWLRPDTQR